MRKLIKPKNKVFCRGCNKEKILFATKENADNFLKFNRNDILERKGEAPVRSYYCRFCLGYHVTSYSSRSAMRYFQWRDKKLLRKLSRAANRQKDSQNQRKKR